MLLKIKLLMGLLVILAVIQTPASTSVQGNLSEVFKNPPQQYHPRPFYWLNAELDSAILREQIQAMHDKCGFGGFSPIPMSLTRPGYLTEEYFDRYSMMLETASELGLKVDFYDDIDYPAGSVGGVIASQYPEHRAKNLRKTEERIKGPTQVELDAPEGRLMAAVAMEFATLERINLASFVHEGTLNWNAPAGEWNIMFFTCVPEGNLIDYLDPESVDLFIDLTYGEYERRFGEHFGTTIIQAFTDDVALYFTSGQRTWTYDFNRAFEERHGYDPSVFYPALWYDIGPNTQAARADLFGFRAELFSEVWNRKIHEWCNARGVQTSGHPMGPFNLQPVNCSGDNILFHRHIDIPTFDSIHYYGLGRDGFKLTSSAAANYDKPLTAVEIYGAYPDNTVDVAMLYRSLMEVFARGANVIIPHGMWYDINDVRCPPEISHRSARLGLALPDYSRYASRCSALLQGGRNVADIGILYPIQALQAAYSFGTPAAGGFGHRVGPEEADYLDISDRLTGRVRRDFTFLHPDIIDERCTVEGAVLRLNNADNWQEYQVVIIPGGKVISWSNLQKIQQFYDQGGKVIATTQLPFKSSEFGHDDDVRLAIETMFGDPDTASDLSEPYRTNSNRQGGKAYFLVSPTVDALRSALDDALPVADVAFEGMPQADSGGGMLSYLHQVKDGMHIYFFANSSNDSIDVWVRLRGKRVDLKRWDPHDGTMLPQDCEYITVDSHDVTRVHLMLEPVKSIFLTAPVEEGFGK